MIVCEMGHQYNLLDLCFVGVFFVHRDGIASKLVLLRPPRQSWPLQHLPLVAMVARHRTGAVSSLGKDWRVYEWGFRVSGFERVTGSKGKGNEK